MQTQAKDEGIGPVRTYLLLCAMPLFFSSNVIIGRAAADLVPPSTLAFWRWFIAFAILLPIAWQGLKHHRADLWLERKAVALLAFLGMGICGAVVYVGLKYTTATNAALIYTATPVLVITLEWAFSNQRLNATQFTGIVAALLGVLVIIFKGDPQLARDLDLNIGDLCIAAGAASWALYSIILKRPRLKTIPTMPLMAATTCMGAILLAPFAVWEYATIGGVPSTTTAWASIFGVALVASVLAFSSYQKGVQLVGPGRTSLFMYLMPLYSALLAALLLGESIRHYHVLGAALIVGGVAAATGLLTQLRTRSVPG